jgi:hypothetical protein
MQIQISLNTQAVDAGDIRASLDAELHALEQPGITITTNKRETEAGALGVFEAYQFIIEHSGAIEHAMTLITAALQVTNTVLKRRGLKSKPKARKKRGARGEGAKTPQPLIVFNVEGKSVELPADEAKLRRYIGSIGKSEGKQPTRPHKSRVKRASKSKK